MIILIHTEISFDKVQFFYEKNKTTQQIDCRRDIPQHKKGYIQQTHS